MSHPYTLKVGDLTLEVYGDYEREGRYEKMWVDEVRLVTGTTSVGLTDLLQAIQKDRPSWYWADWAGEAVINDLRRFRQEVA